MKPLPSTVADNPHGWEPARCSGCASVFAAVASFDAGDLPADLFCVHCTSWRELRCSRCNKVVGSTASAHSAPVLYCQACCALDAAAAARRESAAAVPVRADALERGLA